MENNTNQDDTFTPEELAWRLLLDENVNNVQLLAYSDENSIEILFEILLTIYVEMIFNYYKLQYLESQADNDNFDETYENFKPDLSKINISILTENFDEKIKKLKFVLSVNEISKERYEECKINRYCTIIFKDLLRDRAFFMMNSEYLDPEKRYHFIKNSKYNTTNILRDIFCSFELNDKYYKINFS